MKFGQVIEVNKGNIFLENHAESEPGKVVLFLFAF